MLKQFVQSASDDEIRRQLDIALSAASAVEWGLHPGWERERAMHWRLARYWRRVLALRRTA